MTILDSILEKILENKNTADDMDAHIQYAKTLAHLFNGKCFETLCEINKILRDGNLDCSNSLLKIFKIISKFYIGYGVTY